jgi:hypothetical protein
MAERMSKAFRQSQVGADVTYGWANNAAAATLGTASIASVGVGDEDEFKLVVYNPSAVTDITVTVRDTYANLGGASRQGKVASFTAPKSDTTVQLIHGLSGAVVVQLQNVTALGASDAFTAALRLYAVN